MILLVSFTAAIIGGLAGSALVIVPWLLIRRHAESNRGHIK